MNLSQLNALCILIASFVGETAAFVPSHRPLTTAATSTTRGSKQQHLMMNGDVIDMLSSSHSTTTAATAAASQFNNLLIATIDADIANVPENEFAPIFAGGIMVMFGGVLSALIVGFILESNNSYANVIADSYAQGAEDEEFWKGLSEEEKKKTQELLQKLKASKEGGSAAVAEPLAATSVQETAADACKDVAPTKVEPTGAAATGDAKDSGMFSDY